MLLKYHIHNFPNLVYFENFCFSEYLAGLVLCGLFWETIALGKQNKSRRKKLEKIVLNLLQIKYRMQAAYV